MQRFVGKSTPKAPPPTVGDTTKVLQGRQGALDEKIKKLDLELFEYKKKIKVAKGTAQAALKQRAMAVIKRKKMLEKQRDSVRSICFVFYVA
jgi:charged multivesicular body protein 5